MNLCHDPSHRMPPLPPLSAAMAGWRTKLHEIDQAWRRFVASEQRPHDWLKADEEIRGVLAGVAQEMLLQERTQRRGEGEA